jgi:hypothetical protein
MTAYGSTPINWKRDFPVLRVALGRLGELGFYSMSQAEFLLMHQSTEALRRFVSRTKGGEISKATIKSRMRRTEELRWFKENMATQFRSGIQLGDELAAILRRAGFSPTSEKM